MTTTPTSPLSDTSKRGGQARRERRRDERDERRAAAGRGKQARRGQRTGGDMAAGQDETQTAGSRNGGGNEGPIIASAVLISSQQTTGEDGMMHGRSMTPPRTQTNNIRERHRAAPIERAMRWNDQATRNGTARIQRDRQASRPHDETIDRRPPLPSASDGWRETPRGKQAQGERGSQQEIETENDSQPQSLPAPPII